MAPGPFWQGSLLSIVLTVAAGPPPAGQGRRELVATGVSGRAAAGGAGSAWPWCGACTRARAGPWRCRRGQQTRRAACRRAIAGAATPHIKLDGGVGERHVIDQGCVSAIGVGVEASALEQELRAITFQAPTDKRLHPCSAQAALDASKIHAHIGIKTSFQDNAAS